MIKTTKLTLIRAIELRKYAEQQISDLKSLVKQFAVYSKNNESPIEYDSTITSISKWIIFLNQIKLEIHKANLKKGKREKVCNQQYIFELSNINAELDFYHSIPTETKQNQVSLVSGEKVTVEIIRITRRIAILRDKLDKFNLEKTVKLKIDEDLGIIE